MNVGLMVAVGVIPALITAVILMLVSKKHKVLYGILLGFFALTFITGAFFHCKDEFSQNKFVENNVNSLYSDISLAREFAAEENYGKAIEVLKTAGNSLYDDEQTLLLARLFAAQENYSSALALYSKFLVRFPDKDIQKEADLARLALGNVGFDINLFGKYVSYDPGMDYAEAEALAAKVSKAKSELNEIVRNELKSYKNDNTSRLVSTIRKINSLYDLYVLSGGNDPDEANDLYSELKRALKVCPELEKDPIVRDARIKVLLMTGGINSLTSVLLNNPNEEELLIASELVIKGYITEEQLADHLDTSGSDKIEKVYNQVVIIYDRQAESLPRKNRESFKDYKNSLKDKSKKPGTTAFIDLLDKAAENGSDSNRSKIYTQEGRIVVTDEYGDTAKYIEKAVISAPYSDDSSYSEPMMVIYDVINNSGNASDLKIIYSASEEAVGNVLPIILPSSFNKPAEDKNGNPVYSDNQYNVAVSDWTSDKVSSVNIISVDALDFPEVTLDVTIDADNLSVSKIKQQLALFDCDKEIANFDIKDFTSKDVEIVLVCDVSGSMEGNAVSNLKSAVTMFLDDKTRNESIGIVTFSGSVEDVAEIGAKTDELNALVGGMYASGGTNIYNAMDRAVGMFSNSSKTFKIIVLMSDGQDGSYMSAMDINNNLISPCVENGIVVYSLGLGSVDLDRLQEYTDGTGGTVLYAVDSASLSASYATLHNIIAGRYSITYTALDTFTQDRYAEIRLKNSILSSDRRNYTLPGAPGDGTPHGSASAELYSWIFGKSISGLDTKLIYQSSKDTVVKLNCSGFDKHDTVSMKANGKLPYTLSTKFVSENEYEVTVPSGMAVGEYELEITVNGRKLYIRNGLIICARINEFTFGPYSFTSAFREFTDDGLKLSGCVTMNGWLKFNGEITIEGDLDNKDSLSYITLIDQYGSTVEYNASTAENLALLLAKCHKSVNIAPLNGNRLYRDTDNASPSDLYQKTGNILIPSFFEITSPGVALYPDKIVINMNAFSTRLSHQDKLISKKELFNFQTNSTVTITNTNIGAEITVEAGQNDKTYYPVNLGNTPIYAGKNNMKLTLNTMDPSVYVKFGAKLAFLDADSLGLEIKWEGVDLTRVNPIVPKMIKISADFDVNTTISGVPVTFSDFSLGIDDINLDILDKDFLNLTLEGSTKISVAKVASVLPGLEKYVGKDTCIASLDNTTVKLKLRDMYFKLSTEAKLFDALQLGSAEIEAGKNFTYSNALLNLKNEDVAGLRAKLTIGVGEDSKDLGTWSKSNVNISINGSLELDLMSKVLGIYCNGNAYAEVHWWIFDWSPFDLHGEAFVGLYTTHDNDVIFTVRGSGTDNKNNKHTQGEISWSAKNGDKVKTMDL